MAQVGQAALRAVDDPFGDVEPNRPFKGARQRDPDHRLSGAKRGDEGRHTPRFEPRNCRGNGRRAHLTSKAAPSFSLTERSNAAFGARRTLRRDLAHRDPGDGKDSSLKPRETFMGVRKLGLAAIGAALLASTAALADDVKPAIIYDLGGKFDKSFNEGVFNGATKFTKDTGIDFRELEIQNEAQREQVLRKFAKDGYSPIIMPGFAWATALGKVADEFPKTKFGIIDSVVDKPNVQSMVFKTEQSSFLVGVIAAKTTKTDKVGFVGGMDIPLISKFECGYAQGVKYVNAKDEVYANMTGTTPAAWNDPVKGGELAKSQMDRG